MNINYCQTKVCSKCKEIKDICEFHNDNKVKSSNLHCWCKNCKNKASRDNIAKNPEKHRQVKAKHAITKYGITLEQHKEMLNAQGGKCAICKRLETDCDKRLCIDHNHLTDKVRGLLCAQCNTALGLFNDDIEHLQTAIGYLTTNK